LTLDPARQLEFEQDDPDQRGGQLAIADQFVNRDR
jgi:hypothetical protein